MFELQIIQTSNSRSYIFSLDALSPTPIGQASHLRYTKVYHVRGHPILASSKFHLLIQIICGKEADWLVNAKNPFRLCIALIFYSHVTQMPFFVECQRAHLSKWLIYTTFIKEVLNVVRKSMNYLYTSEWNKNQTAQVIIFLVVRNSIMADWRSPKNV